MSWTAETDWKATLFSFEGRLNRAGFWRAVLINVAIWIASAAIAFLVVMAMAQSGFARETAKLSAYIIFVPALIFTFWVNLAASVKRLHDREKTGRWMWLYWGLPAVLDLVAALLEGGAGDLLSVAAIFPALWGFAEVGFLEGTAGPNAYGSDPLSTQLA